METKELFAKVSLSFLLKIFSAGVAYPTAILLARQLGSDGYGVYGFVLALLGLLIYPTVSGQDQLILRDSVKVRSHIEGGSYYPLMHFSAKFVFFIGVVVALSLTSLIINFPLFLGEYSKVTLIAIWILPIYAIRRIFTSTLRVIGSPVQAIIPESFIQPTLMFLLVFIIYLNDIIELTPEIAISIQLCGYLMSLLFVAAFFYMKRRKMFVNIGKQRQKIQFKKSIWLKIGFFMALMATAEGFAMFIDRLMLGFFRPMSEVGTYLVASRNTSFVLFLESAFLLVTMPIISKMYTKGENFKKIVSIQTISVSIFTGLFLVLFIVLGEWIIDLFGADFINAYTPMLILSSTYFIGSLFGAGPHVLMMIGAERKASNILLISTIINVSLNFILIPLYGIQGAAAATLASELLKKTTSYIVLKKMYKLDISIFSIKNSFN
ncbi:MAG: polysaccharide biosynthesis C-terminal domain-containing protein [Methyloprofundus sp.]|nr:polysaccharide biosynthesis C-terminal domain-containing protein [Methyloprofundus sp.]